MRLKDGTILMHKLVPYDPAKAHEYYIRNRQLKGRKAGQFHPPSPRTKSSGYTVRTSGGKTVQLTAKELADRQAYIAKRVEGILKSLTELGNKLNKAMSEAKQKQATSKQKAAAPPTAAAKSKAARASKQSAQKHQTQIATKKKTQATKKSAPADPVAELEHKITQLKGRLTAAVAKQRALSAATKNG